MVEKHRVFISYNSPEDDYYKEYLLLMNRKSGVFASYFLNEDAVGTDDMTTAQIRKVLREKYIKTATVQIVLCGRNTKKKRKVDEEIYAAMYDTKDYPKLGILVINLQGSRNSTYAATKEDKALITPMSSRPYSSNRDECMKAYPELPSRILDNHIKGVPISIIDWSEIKDKPDVLLQLIDNAHNIRETNEYDHSAPLKRDDL